MKEMSGTSVIAKMIATLPSAAPAKRRKRPSNFGDWRNMTLTLIFLMPQSGGPPSMLGKSVLRKLGRSRGKSGFDRQSRFYAQQALNRSRHSFVKTSGID